MVAYSFQKRFAGPIKAGTKCQTIRSGRQRHARAGEMLQLYTGMRTTNCSKIVADPLCTAVEPILIDFDADGKIVWIEVDGSPVDDLDHFALEDGFEGLADMAGFWVMNHGLLRIFHGVLIRWVPVIPSRHPATNIGE